MTAKGYIVVFFAVFIAFTAPPARAQRDCDDVTTLPREVASKNRLAVMIDGKWQPFSPNDSTDPHVLQPDGFSVLCLAWEAPPYERGNRQIVYASTQYRDDQPLWLYRNNAAAAIPFLGRLLSDWSREPDSSNIDPDTAFRSFHDSLPDNTDVVPWNKLADWHDTSAWLANRSSYDLVTTTANRTALPHGTEQLILLAAQRPFTSWIPFRTLSPATADQDELRVAVSYSGYLEETSGPQVHNYSFVIE